MTIYTARESIFNKVWSNHLAVLKKFEVEEIVNGTLVTTFTVNDFQEALNKDKNQPKLTNSLLNFETVKYFNDERHQKKIKMNIAGFKNPMQVKEKKNKQIKDEQKNKNLYYFISINVNSMLL